jgi:hypothetical protein
MRKLIALLFLIPVLAFGLQPVEPQYQSRVNVNFYATNVAAGATGVETAITLTRTQNFLATTTGSSFVLTAGKRLRITSITFATLGNATATAQTTTFSVRVNTAGAVTTGSTPIIYQVVSATPAVAGAWDRYQIPVEDGWELIGDGTVQFGITANSVYVTNAPAWYVEITGFEYQTP